jgi:DNA-binding GntR family transcriptional regulator
VPISRASVVDQVVDILRKEILSGRLRPGVPINTSALAREWSVSIIPIREALRILATEGLVRTVPNGSPTTMPLNPEDLSELYRLRCILEGGLAEAAAGRLTEQHVDACVSAYDRMAAADPEDVHGDFWAAHQTFHRVLLQPACGEWGNRLLMILWQGSERYQRATLDFGGSLARAQAEHAEMIKAARSRDPAALRAVLLRHFESMWEAVQDWPSDEEGDSLLL